MNVTKTILTMLDNLTRWISQATCNHEGMVGDWRVPLATETNTTVVHGLRCDHCSHVTCNRILRGEETDRILEAPGGDTWTTQTRPITGWFF